VAIAQDPKAKFHAIPNEAAQIACVKILIGAHVVGCTQASENASLKSADGRSLSGHLIILADSIYSAMRSLVFEDCAAPLATREAT
jgi:2-polyprenyl-6-methoxyphenol hydroxylase-like FAD-dependent oxidoreductase